MVVEQFNASVEENQQVHQEEAIEESKGEGV
jgi:hypothetical protein